MAAAGALYSPALLVVHCQVSHINYKVVTAVRIYRIETGLVQRTRDPDYLC